jgi:hypothetical protein
MRVSVEQRHIDNGLRCSTAHPVALAIKEEFDKLPVPPGYLRVERVVSVSSSVCVIEHRIVKRRGREEVDLAWQRYWFGQPIRTVIGGKTIESYNLSDPAYAYMGDFDNGRHVEPTILELIPNGDLVYE